MLARNKFESSSVRFEIYDQREISQQAIEKAPCISFNQFRQVARKRGWTLEWLVEQIKGELDKPTDTLRRILYGAPVNGKPDMLADVVLPYTCLIELYQRATAPVPALAGDRACACGCGAKVRGKKKWARPGCKKKVQRQSETYRKVAV